MEWSKELLGKAEFVRSYKGAKESKDTKIDGNWTFDLIHFAVPEDVINEIAASGQFKVYGYEGNLLHLHAGETEAVKTEDGYRYESNVIGVWPK